MNEINKILDKLCDLTIDSTKQICKSILKYYNRIKFDFNKQNTIKKMYEPSIEKRLTANEALLEKLKKLKNEENTLSSTIKGYQKEVSTLDRKIHLIQDILNPKKSDI
ncbi:hypothetical protein [Clostridium ihumii]|uniref:hypothetical protein n=1 Tax=Clostridium ihumii TaxID=1470356 RepID=UPI00058BEBD1|nr:hypothetical protein [Clostridium ihumii]